MPQRLYLDACLFIGHFDQDYDEGTQACVQSVFAEVEKGSIYAVTSTVTYVEILSGAVDILKTALDGRKGEAIDADITVMRLARDVRTKVKIPVPGGKPKTLDLPDCIHIAAAKLHQCDALVTLDHDSILKVRDELHRKFGVLVKTPCEVTQQWTLPI